MKALCIKELPLYKVGVVYPIYTPATNEGFYIGFSQPRGILNEWFFGKKKFDIYFKELK